MKTYTREASVSWLGTRQHGKGSFTSPSSPQRKTPFSSGNGKGGAMSPPELVAAAHAGSFSLSLANELGLAGFTPEKIDIKTTVTMEAIGAVWKMTQIHLDVVATVPRVLQCNFIDAAMRAKAHCAISQLVSANISMSAKLNRRGAAARLLPHHPIISKMILNGENKATLGNGHLSKTNQGNGHSSKASLGNGHSSKASLGNGHSSKASLGNGHLSKTNLGNGHLSKTNLGNGHLSKTNLGNGHLSKATQGNGHSSKASLGNGHVNSAGLKAARPISFRNRKNT